MWNLLHSHLSNLQPEEIIEFQRIFTEYHQHAYTWELWGAAYIIGGGCSDDAFMDFRTWLISSGKDNYERAVLNPEAIVDIKFGADGEEDAFFEEFAYVARQVYEEKTGEEMPYRESNFISEPGGKEWNEDNGELSERFPLLWAKFGD